MRKRTCPAAFAGLILSGVAAASVLTVPLLAGTAQLVRPNHRYRNVVSTRHLFSHPSLPHALATSIVSLSNPGPEIRAGAVTLRATARGDIPITHLTFRVGRTTVGTARGYHGAYAYTWHSSPLSEGAYPVIATATNALGISTSTKPINITVSNRVMLGAALGSAVVTTPDKRYPHTFRMHFDSVTPENELKWDALEPHPRQFSFTTADSMVTWALSHGKTVHGHTLVWHNQLPAWLTDHKWSREALRAVLKRHIQTIVSHFRGRVSEWDVVNEPLNADGSLRSDLFSRVLGPDYIADALRWASQADPDALLFINEFGTERVNAKSNGLIRLAKSLLRMHVPLDGIGFQMHVQTNWFPRARQLERVMNRFAVLGLRTDVTEMDVKTSFTPGGVSDKLAAEANVYVQAARACAAVPACTRFATWGVSDAITWIGSDELPLLFDAAYQPKRAYGDVIDALQTRR